MTALTHSRVATANVSGHRIGTWLARLGGGRADLLAADPSGLPRFAAMGGVILSTAVLAAVSATFGLHMALQIPVWLAALFGFGWGVVILNLDRMLVLGMGHERSWRRNLAMALPRVALALILGTVISTPLTLQIFHTEIAAQMAVMQQEREEAFDNQLAGMTSQIDALQAKVSNDQAVLASGGVVDPGADPRVKTAQANVNDKQAVFNRENDLYQSLQGQAQCEFNGTCGTGVKGNGPQYRAAAQRASDQKKIADAAFAELTAAQQGLTQAQQQAVGTARNGTAQRVADTNKDLTNTQKQLTTVQARKTVFQDSFSKLNANDTGILSRLEALDRLASQRSVMRLAQVLLALLFISVEILPVLMKFLVNLGQETNYDRVLRRAEERDLNAFHLDADAAHQAAVARANLVVDDEKDRVAGQKQVLAQINQEVIQRQKEVVTEALRLWSAHAKQQSARVLASYQQSLQAQPAPTAGPAPRPAPTRSMPTSGPATRPAPPPSMPPPAAAPTVVTTYGVNQSSPTSATDSNYVNSMQLPPEDEA